MAEKGIHAVLFVLSAKNRISQEEESTLNALQRLFESKILDYFIVVFTGGDELEAEEQTLDDYLREGCPEFLTTLLRLYGGRKVLVDNRTTDKVKRAEQLTHLLGLVADIGKQNDGIPYTDKIHRTIKILRCLKSSVSQEEIESKNLAEANIALMKEKLRMEHEHTIGMIQQSVERALKLDAAIRAAGPKFSET